MIESIRTANPCKPLSPLNPSLPGGPGSPFSPGAPLSPLLLIKSSGGHWPVYLRKRIIYKKNRTSFGCGVCVLLDLDTHRVLLFVRTNRVHLSNLFDPSGPVLQAPLSRSDRGLLFDLEYLAFQEPHLGREILCHPVAT